MKNRRRRRQANKSRRPASGSGPGSAAPTFPGCTALRSGSGLYIVTDVQAAGVSCEDLIRTGCILTLIGETDNIEERRVLSREMLFMLLRREIPGCGLTKILREQAQIIPDALLDLFLAPVMVQQEEEHGIGSAIRALISEAEKLHGLLQERER